MHDICFSSGVTNLKHMWHKWQGQSLYVPHSRPGRGHAAQQQIRQKVQETGQGKRIKLALRKGTKLICSMSAKRLDATVLHTRFRKVSSKLVPSVQSMPQDPPDNQFNTKIMSLFPTCSFLLKMYLPGSQQIEDNGMQCANRKQTGLKIMAFSLGRIVLVTKQLEPSLGPE